MKQIHIVCRAALIPLVCLLVLVWKFERERARPRLDHALIAAIQRDDALEAVRLLREGANPNASNAPPPPSFWQWLRRRWRGENPPIRDGKTAMQIAFFRALPDPNEATPPYESRLWIVSALHERGARDWHGQNPPNAAPPSAPSAEQQGADGIVCRADAAAQLAAAPNYVGYLWAQGVSVPALMGLGQCHLRLGDVEGADACCRLAQIWEPNAAAIAALRAQIKQQARQISLNAALIRAVWRDETAGVAAALAQGAAPNSRAIPTWDTIRTRLPEGDCGTDAVPDVYPTALKIAVFRDMTAFCAEWGPNDTAPKAPRQAHFAILKALHDAGAKPADNLRAQEKTLLQPYNEPRSATDFPNGGSVWHPNDYNAAATARFMNVYGMSARAYSELARYCGRLDAWEWAVHAYRVAWLWNPADPKQADAARNAEAILRVRRGIQRTLPADCTLRAIRAYPGEGLKRRWAVLYRQATPQKSGWRLAVYGETAAGFRRQFETEWLTAGPQATLYVRPLTGRRLPEIVGYAQDEDTDKGLAQMVAYALEGGKWRRILTLNSNQGAWLEHLRGERAYVARCGWDRLRAVDGGEAGRGYDLYAYNGRKYTFADAKYPEALRKAIKEAEDTLRRTPNDSEALYRLARIYSCAGHPRKAEPYWRRAERAIRKDIRECSELYIQGVYKAALKDIQARRLVVTDSD